MEFRFLGGAREVGRSATLMKDSADILFDCGVKVDGKTEYPIEVGKVDLCILSHAHLDHSGATPELYNSSLPVSLGTAPTLKLAELLIEDSMKLARRKHEKPRFFRNQFRTFSSRYISLDYSSPFGFGEYDITLVDAGHICGSAISSVERTKDNKRVVYTGDFKIGEQILQKSADLVKSDVLIIESTYATKEHPDRSDLTSKFVDEIKETIDNGGTAILPVFAVGRSQEILALLYKNNLIGKAYLDGMAKAATEIVMMHKEFGRNYDILKNAVQKSIWIKFGYQRRDALQGGRIIVTTSGMLTGGPVLNYITKLNKNSKIFLTGYQVEGTNGRRLLDGMPLIIENKKVRINAPVSFYDFSAHAGKSDLYDYVKRSGPEYVFCIHGDKESSKSLANGLTEEGFKAFAPKLGEAIKVDF